MKNKNKGGKASPAAFKIEKGVTIPPKLMMGALSPASQAMLQLEIGDSFVISDKKPDTVMGNVRAMNSRMRKMKKTTEFTARRVSEGVRVWRTK